MSAEWRAVPGYKGKYEVSNDGQVRSLPRMVLGRWGEYRIKGRVLSQHAASLGHLRVNLCRDSQPKMLLVHTLVLAAFVGPRPPGMFGLHNDGNAQNNALGNLRWGTPSENMQDCLRHGTHHQINKTHCPQGHPYDEPNTRLRANGSRLCRTCHRASEKRRRDAA